MLLNKNAFLRANVSEIIQMEALQSRVQKFSQFNEDYKIEMQELQENEARMAAAQQLEVRDFY